MITTLVVSTFQAELKILSTPDGTTRPPPCALTCTGVARHRETLYYSWIDLTTRQAWKNTDITWCGFTTAPIVVATLRSPFAGDTARDRCPFIYVNRVDKDIFSVLTIQDATAAQMTGRQCDIYWTANGYSC